MNTKVLNVHPISWCNCPFDIVVEKPPNTPKVDCPIQYVQWLQHTLFETFDKVSQHLQQAASRQKSDHDKNAKQGYRSRKICLEMVPSKNQWKIGFGVDWTLPYCRKNSDLTYKIQKTPQTEPISVHIDHLKPYLC